MVQFRLLPAALLALPMSLAHAGVGLDLALEPGAQVAAGDQVFARVRSPSCVSLPGSVVPVRQGSQIQVSIPVQDYCDPVGAQDRSYALAPLPAGRYDVVLRSCALAPPGVDPCSDVERLPLVVTGSGSAPVSLPATGGKALVLLVLAALLAGACRMRARQVR